MNTALAEKKGEDLHFETEVIRKSTLEKPWVGTIRREDESYKIEVNSISSLLERCDSESNRM